MLIKPWDKALGARECIPIYNALDATTHYPVSPDSRFAGDLGFLGNRMPDRETRVEEFFFRAAAQLPDYKFILGGNGWGSKEMPVNVNYLGHIYTHDHNAFNCTPKAVFNISRESMARYGFFPATRVFEAAGAGACIITDFWKGIELFLEPEREIIVAENSDEVAEILRQLTPEKASKIGEAARGRVFAEYTYAHRAEQLEAILFSGFDLRKTNS